FLQILHYLLFPYTTLFRSYNDKGIYIHNLDILHFSSVYVSGYKGIGFLECLRNQLNFKENVIKMNSEQMEKSIKAGATLKLPSKDRKSTRLNSSHVSISYA